MPSNDGHGIQPHITFHFQLLALFLRISSVCGRVFPIFVPKINIRIQMESFSDLIKLRRSMRRFTEEELTQEQVVALMKAALMAPSSKRSTPWQFIVVDDKELLLQLSLCKAQGSQFLADAPLAVVVAADPLASDVWIEDASIAAIYVQLQAEDLGLGSCWVQVRERYTQTGIPSDDYVHNVLNLPLQLQTVCIIAVGHKGMERKPFNEEFLQWEKIHLNRYQEGGQE